MKRFETSIRRDGAKMENMKTRKFIIRPMGILINSKQGGFIRIDL